MSNFEAPQPAAGQPHDPTEDFHVPEALAEINVEINQAPVSEVNIPVTNETPADTPHEQDLLEADTEARVAEAMDKDAALFAGDPVAPDTPPTIAKGAALFSDWQGEPTPEPVAETNVDEHAETQDESPREVAEVDVRELDDSALDAIGKKEGRLAAVQAESARNKLPGVGAALRQMTSGTFTDEDMWKELDAKKDEPEDESADQPKSEPEA